MAITNTALQNADAQSIFTSTGTHGDIVTVIYLCNVDTVFETANVFVVQNGDTPDPTYNIIYSNVFIAAEDTLVVDMEKIVLSPGDYIAANCTTSNMVVATVSTLVV